ncbi:MAG: hypothetical protein U0791_08995 [Gemmataceae bacterium]
MTLHLRSWLGPLAATLALSVVSTPVLAAGWSVRGDAAPVQRKETLWGLPRNDPAIAIGAIAAAAALFVGIAWVAARVGDKS